MPAVLLLSPAGEVLARAGGSRSDDWEAFARRVEEALAGERLGAARPRG
jgi:hypothetical protein